MTATIRLFRVDEGPEHHLVAAFDEPQARGIAFGYRYADANEWWGEPGPIPMPVEEVSDELASRLTVGFEDPPEGQSSRATALELLQHVRERGTPEWFGGTLW